MTNDFEQKSQVSDLNNSQELEDEEENLFRDVITDGGVFDDTRFKGNVPHYEKFNTRQYFFS